VIRENVDTSHGGTTGWLSSCCRTEACVSVVPFFSTRETLCLDPNFRVPKHTVAFYLYLVIIVQLLSN
jgi:hypothetical protein